MFPKHQALDHQRPEEESFQGWGQRPTEEFTEGTESGNFFVTVNANVLKILAFYNIFAFQLC